MTAKEQREKVRAIRDNLQFRMAANTGHNGWGTVNALEKSPLSERQTARANWMDAMRQPGLVADAVARVFGGDYGEGAYYAALGVACQSGHANKVATLGQLVAGLAWHCPPSFARDGWKRLDKYNQIRVNREVEKAIKAGFESEVLT